MYFLTTRRYFIWFSQATVTTQNFLWIITALSREFPYLLLVLGTADTISTLSLHSLVYSLCQVDQVPMHLH